MSNEPEKLKQFRLKPEIKDILKNKEEALKYKKEYRIDMYEKFYNEIGADELRTNLKERQGSICCYCMSNIENGQTKIEHYYSREENPHLVLEYSHLYLACDGEKTHCQDNQDSTNVHNLCKCKYEKEDFTKRIVKHCDTCKGNRELTYIRLESIEQHIKYQSDGTIYSDDTNIDFELNNVLNLNINILKNNRLQAKNDLWKQLPQDGTWRKTQISKQIEKYKNQSPKAPYIGILLYFLKKHEK